MPASESRPRVRSAGFVALTLLGVALCAYVAFPLLAPILWAMTLAIVAHPLHRRAERRFGHGSVIAAAVTTAVALLVAAAVRPGRGAAACSRPPTCSPGSRAARRRASGRNRWRAIRASPRRSSRSRGAST